MAYFKHSFEPIYGVPMYSTQVNKESWNARVMMCGKCEQIETLLTNPNRDVGDPESTAVIRNVLHKGDGQCRVEEEVKTIDIELTDAGHEYLRTHPKEEDDGTE